MKFVRHINFVFIYTFCLTQESFLDGDDIILFLESNTYIVIGNFHINLSNGQSPEEDYYFIAKGPSYLWRY